MPTRIAICDDTADDIAQLKEALYNYDPTYDIISYTDGQTLIADFMNNKHAIDILFLDICMPGTDGIKTAEKIRSIKKDIIIVFVTSSRDYYSQAYEVFAFNYWIFRLCHLATGFNGNNLVRLTVHFKCNCVFNSIKLSYKN